MNVAVMVCVGADGGVMRAHAGAEAASVVNDHRAANRVGTR